MANYDELDVAKGIQIMSQALNESVKLQSFYAKLLNMYDGGKRREFANTTEWIDRLIEIGAIKP
jgi:phage terminase large subunit-like protein